LSENELYFCKNTHKLHVTQHKNSTTTHILTTYGKNDIPWLLFSIFYYNLWMRINNRTTWKSRQII